MPAHDPPEAVQALDLVLEFFGEDGANWTRGRFDDGRGRRCILGALDYVHYRHSLPIAGAKFFLEHAIPPSLRRGLIDFNDDRCRGFAEMREVILKARALALTRSRHADRANSDAPGTSNHGDPTDRREPAPVSRPIPRLQGYLADLPIPLAVIPYLKPDLKPERAAALLKRPIPVGLTASRHDHAAAPALKHAA
jgi:hypothetical protein